MSRIEIALVVVTIGLAFLLGRCSIDQEVIYRDVFKKEIVKADTVVQTIIDTVEVVKWQTKTVTNIPDPDTVYVNNTPLNRYEDEVNLGGDFKLRYTTLVTGRLIDQQFTYLDSRPQKIRKVTIREPYIIKEDPKRFGLGVITGFDVVSRKPIIGIGVSYDIIRF